jgi:hypothetical protein
MTRLPPWGPATAHNDFNIILQVSLPFLPKCRVADPRIRIRTKMSQIHNAGYFWDYRIKIRNYLNESRQDPAHKQAKTLRKTLLSTDL